jgi:2,3-dihydroxybenzoate-AMP ligase
VTRLEGFVPHPEPFVKKYRELGFWEGRPLGAVFDQIFTEHAARVAVVHGQQRITYGRLKEVSDQLALHLLELGLEPLDRVVMQLPNVPDFLHLYFALQKVGAIPIMALPPHRFQEIDAFVRLSGAVGYAFPSQVGSFAFSPLAEQVKAANPGLRLLLVAGDATAGQVSLSDLKSRPAHIERARLADIPIDPLEPALFLLSGGTTGVPKLIPRTHDDYVYNSRCAAAVNDIHADDALLVVLPAGHNFPLACPGIQGFLLNGARVILCESTAPADALTLVEREGVTHVELVPALLIRWLNDPAMSRHDLGSIRVINTGGQRLQPEVKRLARQMLPSATVQEVFGMAEGLLMFVRLDDPEEVQMETVGRPVSPGDEVRLVDDRGADVPDGEVGELLVRGPYTLRGYFRAPEHNALAFTEDGFYRSGDLMRRHPSGSYVVAGRKKDLINRGGEKISAEEVENLALGHPAIVNVACVPVPDQVLGERMCACVVLRPGASLSLEELGDFLTDKGLARFKHPERLQLMEELPTSKVGKVAKNELVEMLGRLTES